MRSRINLVKLFLLPGELFEVPDVVGCVLSTRYKDDIISIWNYSNATNPQVRFRLVPRVARISLCFVAIQNL